MQTYCVYRRGDPQDRYWLKAQNPSDARHFVALNVPEAADAEKDLVFRCVVEDRYSPAPGVIVSEGRMRIPITTL